jgi:hypothetical protein
MIGTASPRDRNLVFRSRSRTFASRFGFAVEKDSRPAWSEIGGILKGCQQLSFGWERSCAVLEGPRLDWTKWRGLNDPVQSDRRMHETDGWQDFFEGRDCLRSPALSDQSPRSVRSFQVTNVFANMSAWENIRCALLWTTGHRYACWKNIDNLSEVRERTAPGHAKLAESELLSRGAARVWRRQIEYTFERISSPLVDPDLFQRFPQLLLPRPKAKACRLEGPYRAFYRYPLSVERPRPHPKRVLPARVAPGYLRMGYFGATSLLKQKREVEFNEKRNTANATGLHSCLDTDSPSIRAAGRQRSIQPGSECAICCHLH